MEKGKAQARRLRDRKYVGKQRSAGKLRNSNLLHRCQTVKHNDTVKLLFVVFVYRDPYFDSPVVLTV